LGRYQLGPSFSLIFIDRRALPRRVSSASLLQPHASLRSGPRETAKSWRDSTSTYGNQGKFGFPIFVAK
jgi:hypothetical protein